MPDTQGSDGTQAQILLKLGEMSTQLAVITTRLDALPDHESRLRALERFRWTLFGLWVAGTTVGGFAGYLVSAVKK